MFYEASALSPRPTKQLEIKTQNSVLVPNCTCTINYPILSLIASQERNFVLVSICSQYFYPYPPTKDGARGWGLTPKRLKTISNHANKCFGMHIELEFPVLVSFGSWGNLTVLPASKEAVSPSHIFCSVLFCSGGGEVR